MDEESTASFGCLSLLENNKIIKTYNLQHGLQYIGNSTNVAVRLGEANGEDIYCGVSVNENEVATISSHTTLGFIKVNGKAIRKHYNCTLKPEDIIEINNLTIKYTNHHLQNINKDFAKDTKIAHRYFDTPRKVKLNCTPMSFFKNKKLTPRIGSGFIKRHHSTILRTPNSGIMKWPTKEQMKDLEGPSSVVKHNAAPIKSQIPLLIKEDKENKLENLNAVSVATPKSTGSNQETDLELSIAKRRTPRSIKIPRKYLKSPDVITSKKTSMTTRSVRKSSIPKPECEEMLKDVTNSPVSLYKISMEDEDIGEVVNDAKKDPLNTSFNSTSILGSPILLGSVSGSSQTSRRSKQLDVSHSQSESSILESINSSSFIYKDFSDMQPSTDAILMCSKLFEQHSAESEQGFNSVADEITKQTPNVFDNDYSLISDVNESEAVETPRKYVTTRTRRSSNLSDVTNKQNAEFDDGELSADVSFDCIFEKSAGKDSKIYKNCTNDLIQMTILKTPGDLGKNTSINKKTKTSCNNMLNVSGIGQLSKTLRIANNSIDSDKKSTHSPQVRKRSIKKLMHTPKNDLTNIKGLKRLMCTPKIQKSPLNDLCDVEGVKKLLATPKTIKEPLNDLTQISGIKRLLRTPKSQNSPLNDLTDVEGVNKLLAMPKMEKEPLNDLTQIKGIKSLMRTPKVKKSPLNDLRYIKGMKKILATPKTMKEPLNDLTQIKGVKKLMRTPKVQKSPTNDLTDVKGVKRIMCTPKIQKSPKNDLTDIEGLKQLLSTPEETTNLINVKDVEGIMPKILESRNYLTDVKNVKKLLATPKEMDEPLIDLMQIKGVKNLIRTPKVQKSPQNDLTDIKGVKKLLATPKIMKEPLNDLTQIKGVKSLMRTPKVQKSPQNDLTDVKGVKKLLATPKIMKEPLNDLTEIKGVKSLMRTPKVQKSPLNDLTDIRDLKQLLSTPEETNNLTNVRHVKRLIRTPKIQKSPRNDLTNIKGVKKLLATPKIMKEPLNDLTEIKGVKSLMCTPKTQKSPRNDLSDLRGVKKLMRTPKFQKSPYNSLESVPNLRTLFVERKSPDDSLDISPGDLFELTEPPHDTIEGLKKLLEPRMPVKSPKNDYTDVAGVKRMFMEEEASYKKKEFNLSGVKEMFSSLQINDFDKLTNKKPARTYPAAKVRKTEKEMEIENWIEEQKKFKARNSNSDFSFKYNDSNSNQSSTSKTTRRNVGAKTAIEDSDNNIQYPLHDKANNSHTDEIIEQIETRSKTRHGRLPKQTSQSNISQNTDQCESEGTSFINESNTDKQRTRGRPRKATRNAKQNLEQTVEIKNDYYAKTVPTVFLEKMNDSAKNKITLLTTEEGIRKSKVTPRKPKRLNSKNNEDSQDQPRRILRSTKTITSDENNGKVKTIISKRRPVIAKECDLETSHEEVREIKTVVIEQVQNTEIDPLPIRRTRRRKNDVESNDLETLSREGIEKNEVTVDVPVKRIKRQINHTEPPILEQRTKKRKNEVEKITNGEETNDQNTGVRTRSRKMKSGNSQKEEMPIHKLRKRR